MTAALPLRQFQIRLQQIADGSTEVPDASVCVRLLIVVFFVHFYLSEFIKIFINTKEHKYLDQRFALGF